MKVKHRISWIVIDLEDQDREEIKEEDWIEKLHNDKEIWSCDFLSELRKGINKYLPRITDDMIEKMYKQCFATPTKEYFIEIIKQNLPKDLLANPE